jgi:hypothetical protein
MVIILNFNIVGHTYCKNCLISSLQYSKNCPLCRAKLFDHPSDFNHSINFGKYIKYAY